MKPLISRFCGKAKLYAFQAYITTPAARWCTGRLEDGSTGATIYRSKPALCLCLALQTSTILHGFPNSVSY
jgi:hypothetical protein